MKKIGMILTVLLAFLCASVALAKDTPMLRTNGYVTAVENDKAVIKADKGGLDVALYLSKAAYYVDNETGKWLKPENVKKGARIAAFYGPRLTRSIPPQGVATVMVLGAGYTGVDYLRVSKVEHNEKGIQAYDGEKIANIEEIVMPTCHQVRPGDELLVWYNNMNAVGDNEYLVPKAMILNRKL